jgi:hypothetical protein
MAPELSGCGLKIWFEKLASPEDPPSKGLPALRGI